MELIARTLRSFAAADRRQPKVQLLASAISELIERGFWRPGDRLPTEKELCQTVDLSLGTVQSAMRTLTGEGLIERRRGSGSYVANARDLGSTVWHFRFRTRDGSGLLPWEAEVLAVEEVTRGGAWSEFLGYAPSYVKIKRLVSVGGKFKAVAEMYVDGARFRPLLDTPLDVLSSKNLRVYLHERYNAPTFRSIHRVALHVLDAKAARLIDCPAGAAGLKIKALSYSFRDTPISYQEIVIPPIDYELEMLG